MNNNQIIERTRAGSALRLSAFIIDFMVVFMFAYFIYVLAGHYIVDNFTNQSGEYTTDLNGNPLSDLEGNYYQQLEDALANGDITQDEYDQRQEVAMKFYTSFILSITYYYIITIALLHIFYVMMFKGQTLGKRAFRIKIIGNTDYLSLFFREFLLKYVYFYATLGVGLILDFIFMNFTKEKLPIRDLVIKTNVVTLTYDALVSKNITK